MQSSTGDLLLATHNGSAPPRTLRSACDSCHAQKIRCSGGGKPCAKCQKNNVFCHYSTTGRPGKPKGSKNKKTLERERQMLLDGHRKELISGSPITAPPAALQTEDRNEISSQSGPVNDMLADIFWDNASGFTSLTPNMEEGSALSQMDHGIEAESFAPFQSSEMDQNSTEITQRETTPTTPTSLHKMLENTSSHADPISSLLQFPDHSARHDGEMNTQAELPLQNDVLATDSMASFELGNYLPTPDFTTSSQAHIVSRTGSATSSTILDASPLSSSGTAVSSCNCLQIQADHLCRLRLTEQKPRVDTLMRTADVFTASLERTFQCSQCLSDPEVLQLSSMVLKILVRRIGSYSYSPRLQSQNLPDIRIGEYTPGHKDQYWICMMLSIRVLSRYRILTTAFCKKLSQISRSGEHDPSDLKYLENTARVIRDSIENLVKDIQRKI